MLPLVAIHAFNIDKNGDVVDFRKADTGHDENFYVYQKISSAEMDIYINMSNQEIRRMVQKITGMII